MIHRGSAAGSEPETQTLQDYMRSIFADQRGPGDADAAPADTTGLMISLHSYGKWVLFPWGWNSAPSPNLAQLQTLGRKFGFYTNYVVCQSGSSGCIYQTDGTTDDWAYGELGIAAYTFELGTEFFESCSYFDTDIIEQLLTTLTVAAKTARLPYQAPAGPEIVDAVAEPACVAAGDPVTLTVTADDSRFASNDPYFGSEPIQNIAAVSYTVDLPSWVSGAVATSMATVDGFDGPVEPAVALVTTQGWSDGRHQLFIEGQDAAGNVGVPTAVFVTIDADCEQSGAGWSSYLPVVAQNE
ncbi:MAG: hypothetical protein IPK16_13025 [Anaerolineales bacterium]|nr:hypothetical protein [Anaerolineales bacterium]